LGTYCLAWLEGVEIGDDVKEKMKETLTPYNKEITAQNTVSIFNSLRNKRKESITTALDKLKVEEEI
jgi:hypothetical protein